jgi:hypothetical protein
MPKEGSYDYTTCYSGTSSDIQFSKSLGGGSFEYIANNRTDPPGGPFDRTTAHCVGLGIFVDSRYSNSFLCEAADKDGDKFIVRGTLEGPKGKQEVIAGSGKYEGMVRTGTSESLGVFPSIKPGTFTGCIRQTGTYKLK